MKILSITIKGDTTDDLTLALDEVRKNVSEGFVMGKDENETGRYIFDVIEKER